MNIPCLYFCLCFWIDFAFYRSYSRKFSCHRFSPFLRNALIFSVLIDWVISFSSFAVFVLVTFTIVVLPVFFKPFLFKIKSFCCFNFFWFPRLGWLPCVKLIISLSREVRKFHCLLYHAVWSLISVQTFSFAKNIFIKRFSSLSFFIKRFSSLSFWWRFAKYYRGYFCFMHSKFIQNLIFKIWYLIFKLWYSKFHP